MRRTDAVERIHWEFRRRTKTRASLPGEDAVLLLLFGAVSSFDSVPHLPASGPPVEGMANWQERPPLANQLFDTRPIFVDLMERFRDCQAIVPILRQSGTSIEKRLAEFQEQAKTFPLAHRELAAIHYYLHFALWTCQDRWRTKHRGITNFATLLREIERWRYEVKEQVCFVTFNYDTMLEEAMGQVLRLNVQDMDSYHKWANYSLFKLHGSVNWGRVVEDVGISRRSGEPIPPDQKLIDMSISNSFAITGRYHLCGIDMRPNPDDGVVLYPALSIPVENKDTFSCPSGHVVKGKWSRPDPKKPAVYTDASGTEVKLTPGRTWVELPGPGNAAEIPAGADPNSVPFPPA
jgi:hypothetical protein